MSQSHGGVPWHHNLFRRQWCRLIRGVAAVIETVCVVLVCAWLFAFFASLVLVMLGIAARGVLRD